MKHLLTSNQIGEEPADELLLSFPSPEQVMETAGFRNEGIRGCRRSVRHPSAPITVSMTVVGAFCVRKALYYG